MPRNDADTPSSPKAPPGKASVKILAKTIAPWQPSPSKPKAFSLAALDPAAKPFSTGNKLRDKAAVEALSVEIDGLQNLFYADKRYKLLVILQGTDTSGKDGTLRGVF